MPPLTWFTMAPTCSFQPVIRSAEYSTSMALAASRNRICQMMRTPSRTCAVVGVGVVGLAGALPAPGDEGPPGMTGSVELGSMDVESEEGPQWIATYGRRRATNRQEADA